MNLDARVVKLKKYQSLKVLIDVITRTQLKSKRTIRTRSSIILVSSTTTEVSVIYKNIISEDRDFLFESDCIQNFELIGEVFTYIVDAIIFIIQIYNTIIISIRLSRKAKLRALYEYEQNKVFLITLADAYLAAENMKLQKSNLVKGFLIAAAAFESLILKCFNSAPITAIMIGTYSSQIDSNLKYIITNGITVYETPEVTFQIASIANEFPEIWQDQGITVDISEEE